MAVYIGSARIDEHGKLSGGSGGDQKQTSIPDYKGEVSQQTFYVHQKGWVVLRAKNQAIAAKIAFAMATACNNKNIGYSQSDRLGVVKHGTSSKVPTNADCSSLVRQCVKEASGIDAGNFNTSNEKELLMKTGLFTSFVYDKNTALCVGDILVTRTKGHTAIVTISTDQKKKSVNEIALEVIDGKWGTGAVRRQRLNQAGYKYSDVQAEVNRILKKE